MLGRHHVNRPCAVRWGALRAALLVADASRPRVPLASRGSCKAPARKRADGAARLLS